MPAYRPVVQRNEEPTSVPDGDWWSGRSAGGGAFGELHLSTSFCLRRMGTDASNETTDHAPVHSTVSWLAVPKKCRWPTPHCRPFAPCRGKVRTGIVRAKVTERHLFESTSILQTSWRETTSRRRAGTTRALRSGHPHIPLPRSGASSTRRPVNTITQQAWLSAICS